MVNSKGLVRLMAACLLTEQHLELVSVGGLELVSELVSAEVSELVSAEVSELM